MLDGTRKNSQILTYTCMVEMILGLEYIAWKGGLKKEGERKKKQRNLCNNPLNSCNLVYQ